MLQYRQKLAPAPHFQHCHFSAIHCSHNPFRRSGVQSVNFPHCYLPWGTLLCKCRLPQVRSTQTRAQKLLAPAPALAYIHIQSNGIPPTRPEGCKSLQLIRLKCLGFFRLQGSYLCGAWPSRQAPTTVAAGCIWCQYPAFHHASPCFLPCLTSNNLQILKPCFLNEA